MANIESTTVASKNLAELRARATKGKVTWDLHVLVIMRQTGLNKGQASWLAWCEGEKGLEKRLSPTPDITT